MTGPQADATPNRLRLRTRLTTGASIAVVVLLVVIFAERFGEDPRLVDSPLIGEPVTSMSLDRLDGSGPLTFAELRGKVVVVNFWASWCPPCRNEHPHLVQTSTAYRDAPVQFVGIVYQDDAPAATGFLDQLGWGEGYEYVVDPESRAAIEFGVFGVPETFFLNQDGLIVYKIAGPVDSGRLIAAIDAILAGEQPQ